MSKKRTVKDVLIKAKSLLETGWTQGIEANPRENCDADCWSGNPFSPYAGEFCAIGALKRAAWHNEDLYKDALATMQLCLPERFWPIDSSISKLETNIIKFNDSRGRKKKEVVSAFECAISKS